MKRLILILLIFGTAWHSRGQSSESSVENICQASFVTEIDPTNPMKIYFNDHSTGQITDWQWSFGDGTTATVQNPQHTFASGGTYFVCLTISNSQPGNECNDVFCVALTVHEPGTCVADYDYAFDPFNWLKAGFSDESSGNINGWHWDFGDGSASDLQNPVHEFPAPGKYRVCLTAYNIDSLATCNDIKCDSVVVEQMPDCHAAFSGSLDSLNLVPNTFRFTNESTGGPTGFFWKADDGATYESPDVIHQFRTPGVHTMCLTVRKKIQGVIVCTDSVCHSVTTAEYFNIGGHLFAGASPINNPVATGDTGVASLYRVEGSGLKLYEVRTFSHLGYFAFPQKLSGDYLIRVTLTPGSAHYADYLPGYLHSSHSWRDAEVLHLTGSAYQADIHLLPANNELTGPGVISGRVVKGGGGPAEIIPFAGVLLFDAQMVPVRAVTSGKSGEFTLQGLAFGAYTLYVEIPGKYARLTAVWLDAASPLADSLDLEVFDHDVTSISERSPGNAVAGELFPNPASDEVSLPLHLLHPEKLRIEIRSLAGVPVWSGTGVFGAGASMVKLPLTSTGTGIYFVVIQSGDGSQVAVKKLIRR